MFVPTGQAPLGDSPVVEREHELGVLDGFVDAVRSDDGGVVVVEGVAGIGKTHLLRLAADWAAAAGVDTLDRHRAADLHARRRGSYQP